MRKHHATCFSVVDLNYCTRLCKIYQVIIYEKKEFEIYIKLGHITVIRSDHLQIDDT